MELEPAPAITVESHQGEEEALQEAVSTYMRRKPPSQNCDAEQMITIEPISLRKGGWRRSSEGVLNDLRHMDPQVGVMLFFGALTAVTFYLYWKKFKSITVATLYTTSSVAMLALSLSAAFGIDFFGALGAAFMPH